MYSSCLQKFSLLKLLSYFYAYKRGKMSVCATFNCLAVNSILFLYLIIQGVRFPTPLPYPIKKVTGSLCSAGSR